MPTTLGRLAAPAIRPGDALLLKPFRDWHPGDRVVARCVGGALLVGELEPCPRSAPAPNGLCLTDAGRPPIGVLGVLAVVEAAVRVI